MPNPKEYAMKVEYTYRFANGEEITIRIERDELALLREFDRLERNADQRETRRHVPLDAASRIPDEKAPDPHTAFEQAEELREFAQALESLSAKQRELLAQVFYDGIPLVEIARAEKVSQSAISQRINTLRKKLKKLLV
jgi:RNA polymerase sigma factor (sigma-70 family)